MRRLKKLKILVIATLAVFLLTAMVPTLTPAPMGTVQVSYNPSPGDIFHAPLSSIGLLRLSLAQASFSSLVTTVTIPGTVGANGPQNNGSNATRTIDQNAIRFINDTSYFPQSETTIAVDPTNTEHVLGGFNDLKFIFCQAITYDCGSSGSPTSLSGFTVSADGGASVSKGSDLPRLNDSSNSIPLLPFGDPTVASSLDGNFFYGSLAAAPFGGTLVIIAKSNPNLFNPSISCVTSSTPPRANACWKDIPVFGSTSSFFSFEDKPVIAVDRSGGAFSGSVYLAWTHFSLFGASSYLARCDNNLDVCTMLAGGNLAPLSGGDQFADFATPAVDGKGNVHVTWCNIGTVTTFGPITCKIRSSPPGGTDFTGPTTILSFMGPGTMLPNDAYTIGFATEQFRTASVPWLAVDASHTSTSGNLYFTISACTSGRYIAPRSPMTGLDNPGNCGLSSIIFTRSTNGGTTWSTPVTVSQPGVNTQPYITVDPVTGHLFVLYYTTQYDPFNHRIDVVTSRSLDGGSTFHQFRVTSVSNEPDSDPNMFFYPSTYGGSWTSPQYGDYFQATAFGGTLWVLFTANYSVEQGTFQTDPFLAVLAQR